MNKLKSKKLNQDRIRSKKLFIASIAVALLAILIGNAFFPHEDGGPARILGLIAFVLLLLSLVFKNRVWQSEQNMPVTTTKRYIINTVMALIIVTPYLAISYQYLFLGFAINSFIPALAVFVGFLGLIALVFSKYIFAILSLAFFLLPSILWALIQ